MTSTCNRKVSTTAPKSRRLRRYQTLKNDASPARIAETSKIWASASTPKATVRGTASARLMTSDPASPCAPPAVAWSRTSVRSVTVQVSHNSGTFSPPMISPSWLAVKFSRPSVGLSGDSPKDCCAHT